MGPRSSGPFVADLGAGFGDESFAYVDPPGLPVDLVIRDGQLIASWTRGVTAREVSDVFTLVRVWDGAACERVATGKLLMTS